MTYIRNTCIAALLFALTACGQQHPFGQNLITGPTEFSATSPYGLVVLGLVSDTKSKGLLTGESAPSYELTWKYITKVKRVPNDASALDLIADARRSSSFGSDPYSMPVEGIWCVARLTPGTYQLARVTARAYKLQNITEMTGKPDAPFFTVKAGQVRYLGDVHYDVSNFPARFVRLTRNDLKAYEALSNLPGISVAPFFAPPSVVPKDSSRAVRMTVAQ